jgi:uncharacterized membrane-anchored protein YjiN (DUF445 family)
MTNGTVGKDVSQHLGSEQQFQTYRELLRQREKIERELLKVTGKLLKAVSRKEAKTDLFKRVKYVPRLKNDTTLAAAIRECMVPRKEMTMDDILKSLEKKNLYHTDSKYFYTMVNNKLNRDKQIKKVSRGIFVFRPRCRKRKAAGA